MRSILLIMLTVSLNQQMFAPSIKDIFNTVTQELLMRFLYWKHSTSMECCTDTEGKTNTLLSHDLITYKIPFAIKPSLCLVKDGIGIEFYKIEHGKQQIDWDVVQLAQYKIKSAANNLR